MAMFSFKKDEILRRKKIISRLFTEGSSFYIFPFKVFWLNMPLETVYPAQVMISVGKKSFKHAVQRNRIKRLVRESYRQHKNELYEYLSTQQQQCAIALIYTANVQTTFDDTNMKIKAIFKRLYIEMNKKLNNPSIPLSHKEIL